MNTYNVSYDLKKPGQNYVALYAALGMLCPNHCHPLGSTWVVKYRGSALDLVNYLLKFVDANDKLLVMGAGQIAWYGLDKKDAAWLHVA